MALKRLGTVSGQGLKFARRGLLEEARSAPTEISFCLSISLTGAILGTVARSLLSSI